MAGTRGSQYDCDWPRLNAHVLAGTVTLTERQRLVAWARARGHSVPQIVAMTGLPAPTVKGALRALSHKFHQAEREVARGGRV